MGRPQITGKEVCPRCKNLGRIRMKTSRGRVYGRYIRRSWFRHNDESIREHYIDNFTRKKGPLKWTDALSEITHTYARIADLAETFPLKSDERERLFAALALKMKELGARTLMLADIGMKTKYDKENIPIPESLQSRDFAIHFMNHETRERWYVDDLIEKDPASAVEYIMKVRMSDPLYREFNGMFMKYLRPPRLERNKARNEKLKKRYNYPEPTLPSLIQPVDP